MKVFLGVFCIGISILCFGSGCSNEEQVQQPEEKKVVVKKSIPERPKPGPSLVRVKPKPKNQIQDAGTIVVPKKSDPKPAAEVKKEQKPVIKEEKGYYSTVKGDTLAGIAAKLDGYKDPLKWPIIYRLNRDKLGSIKTDKDLPHRNIPEGTRLKVITPDEAKKNLKQRVDTKYVINVLSSQSDEMVVLSTIKLIEKGYPAYITKANVKGQDWTRVRIGFYERKKDADSDSSQITSMLKIPDIWVTTITKEEVETFGRY